MIGRFIATCAGLKVDEAEEQSVLDSKLLEKEERVENMKKGGDLTDPEKLE